MVFCGLDRWGGRVLGGKLARPVHNAGIPHLSGPRSEASPPGGGESSPNLTPTLSSQCQSVPPGDSPVLPLTLTLTLNLHLTLTLTLIMIGLNQNATTLI